MSHVLVRLESVPRPSLIGWVRCRRRRELEHADLEVEHVDLECVSSVFARNAFPVFWVYREQLWRFVSMLFNLHLKILFPDLHLELLWQYEYRNWSCGKLLDCYFDSWATYEHKQLLQNLRHDSKVHSVIFKNHCAWSNFLISTSFVSDFSVFLKFCYSWCIWKKIVIGAWYYSHFCAHRIRTMAMFKTGSP